MIGLSASSAGRVHAICADRVAALATTSAGASGGSAASGVTGFDRADAGPHPVAFSARIANV